MNENFNFEEIMGSEADGMSFDHSGVDSGEFDDSLDFEDSELSLGLVRLVGSEMDGYNQYEFIFTIYPDDFWGDNFAYKPAGICNGVFPDNKYVQKVVIVKTKLVFDLIQESGCFSMQDSLDGIVAIAWENIDKYTEYPEDGRLFFMFGEKYDEVEGKLAVKHILI